MGWIHGGRSFCSAGKDSLSTSIIPPFTLTSSSLLAHSDGTISSAFPAIVNRRGTEKRDRRFKWCGGTATRESEREKGTTSEQLLDFPRDQGNGFGSRIVQVSECVEKAVCEIELDEEIVSHEAI